VAIRKSHREVPSLFRSALMLVPPYTHCTSYGFWKVRRASHSFAICSASSRVGDSTRTETVPEGGTCGERRSASMAGIRKPMVLPVPVLAWGARGVDERKKKHF
jgi:hypothetical protein